jgi:hypothetical protein
MWSTPNAACQPSTRRLFPAFCANPINTPSQVGVRSDVLPVGAPRTHGGCSTGVLPGGTAESARSFGNRCLFEGVVVVLDSFAPSEFEPSSGEAASTRELPVAERLAARRKRFFASQMHAGASELWRGSAPPQRSAASIPSPKVSP